MMEEIIGKVKVIVYHNEDNLYTVLKIKRVDEIDDEYVTITGNFPLPLKDDLYKYSGEFRQHPRFGLQFIASSYEKILPSSKEGIIKYLSSPLFPGIGKKTASLIVDKLGVDALSLIKQDHSILDNLVKDKYKQIIVNGLGSDSYFDEAVKLFVMQGLSIKMLLKIQAVYHEKMIEVIKDNPYKLVEDIDGIGFKTADDFALSLGVSKIDQRRIKAAIIYSLNNILMNEGDTYTNQESIKSSVKELISELDDESIDYFISLLIEEKKIIKEDDKIFSLVQYEAEVWNARYLSLFIKRIISDFNHEEVFELIKKIEDRELILYDNDQIEAIFNCLRSGLSIITGGPGTGKTTIVKALVEIYQKVLSSSKIYLCAPTGRASKRLSELTGYQATTIHRLLKWDLHSNTFSINENNPLEGDILIIDEFSMVDNFLLFNLLKATQRFSQIILIGDDDQLPSVSPGNVLKDLIDSGYVNIIKLKKIYRQKEQSNIVLLAHHIKNSESVHDDLVEDVTFYQCQNSQIKKNILEYIKLAKRNGYTDEQIQVVAPMYKGINGIDSLNVELQEYFNPPSNDKKELKYAGLTFRENDRILQLKNQNEDDVYNGDIGILTQIILSKDDIDSKTKIIVDFDGNRVEYTLKDFINITHAYCISIHKSQGSEYPLLIMPLSSNYYNMLAKNLLYTGITRAKKKLIIIGDYSSFIYGINNTKYKIRKTSLIEKLSLIINKI